MPKGMRGIKSYLKRYCEDGMNSKVSLQFKNQIKKWQDQSVFAICAQDCCRMQLI